MVDVSRFESRLGGERSTSERVLFERVLAAALAADRRGFFVEPDAVLAQDAKLSRDDVLLVWGSSKFQRSLADRGVRVSSEAGLSLRQEMFLQAYLNPLNLKTPQVLARQMKISLAELDGWLRDKEFASVFAAKSEANLSKYLPLADQALGQLVQSGDMKAITFLNQLTGRFDPNGRGSVDVASVLLQVQDIILRHVRDPITKRNIGRELMALAQGASSVSVIPEPVSDDILVSETVVEISPSVEG